MYKNILLVDDDLDDQLFIKAAIEKIIPQHECTVANNGREAMEYVDSGPPYDIVFIDMNMPLMNGFDTLKAIKKIDQYRLTPVIIITSSTDKFDVERCKRFGAAYYLVKPSSFFDLVDELKHILQ